jgi:hypothetical protein
MKRIKKMIEELNHNGTPFITYYDVITGIVVMLLAIGVILSLMTLFEPKRTNKKDANVREESIQHLHPHIP